MRDLLGGKGAGLAEMTKAGLPVPPGFTITTEACNDYFAAGEKLPDGLWDDVLEAVKQVEQETGKGFGDVHNPLLVSVRSGAKFSMPGMMDTVLNLGLNDADAAGPGRADRQRALRLGRLPALHPDVRADRAWASTARSSTTRWMRPRQKRGVKQDTELDAAALREVVDDYLAIVREAAGREFPTDPYQQLDLAIKAVFASWFGKRAHDYREYNKIPHDLGTAVNVVTMVFGNMGDDSGTGVAFTRNPNTGEKVLFGEYLTNAQGEDVVAGIRTPLAISEMRERMPDIYRQFEDIAGRLERHYRDMQDLEFTIERGRLYMLQTRSGKRTATAAVRIAADMVADGIITEQEALQRIEPAHVDQLLRDQFDPNAKSQATKITAGLNASPGAAVGKAVFDADRAFEMAQQGEKVDPRAHRDLARRLPRHGRGAGRADRARRGDVTCRGRGAPDRQAVRRRLRGAGHRLRHRSRPASTAWASAKGSGSHSTGRPARCSSARCPRPQARFEDQPELQKVLEWADRARRLRGVDQRRQARGGGPGAALRRAGHRPVPDRAHVPRGRAARHRPRRDPRGLPGDACQGAPRRRGSRCRPRTRRR